MGGLGIYGDNGYNKLQAALDQATAEDDLKTIDAFFTLENGADPLHVRGQAGNKKLTDRKIKNLPKNQSADAGVSEATFIKDLRDVLSHALGPKIKDDREMQSYLDAIWAKLTGGSANGPTAKTQTLEVRALKQLIADIWQKADDVMFRQYRDDHAEMFKAYDGVLDDLSVLMDLVSEGEDREKILKVVKEYKDLSQMCIVESKHDAGKLAEKLDKLVPHLTTVAEEIRNELLEKAFSRQVQEKCDALTEKAEETERQFANDWNELEKDVLANLSEQEKTAAMKQLQDKATALRVAAGKLKSGTSVSAMKATLAELDKMCAQTEKELNELSTKLLDWADEQGSARAKSRREFASFCDNHVHKCIMITNMMMKGLVDGWQEEYGADGAEDLEKARQAFLSARKEAINVVKQDMEIGELRQDGESTDDLKNRLAAAKNSLKQKTESILPNTRTPREKLQAYKPQYEALIAERQQKSLFELAQGSLKTFTAAINAQIDRAKNQIEKDTLNGILVEAGDFDKPKEGETVDQMKERYLEFVGKLNALYVRAAVDPVTALKDAFESGLKTEIDTFKANAQDVVEKFRTDWNDKFNGNSAYDKTLSKSIVDVNRQAIEKMLTEQIGRLADDVAYEVRKKSGQKMVLTDELKGLFANAIKSLKQQAEKQLKTIENEVKDHANTQEVFNQAMAKFGEAIANVDAVVNGWPWLQTGEKLVWNAQGHLLPETKLYLQSRLKSFKTLLVGMMKSVGAAGMLSSASLKEAADALAKFSEAVNGASLKTVGNPEKLAQLLRALPTPTLVVKTVERDIGDKGFLADGGALPQIAETAPIPVKENLKLFHGLLKDTYASLEQRGILDESSKNTYLALAREVYEDVVQAVNYAVSAGETKAIENGVGKLVREAWGKVSAQVNELENDARQKTLATKALEVLKALDEAKNDVPVKLNRKKYFAVRNAVLYNVERTVETYARLVAVRMDEIRKDGGVPDTVDMERVLKKLDDVLTWVNEFKVKVKPTEDDLPSLVNNVKRAENDESVVANSVIKNIAGFVVVDGFVPYRLDDVPLGTAEREDVFEGVAAEGPENVAALRKAAADAVVKARQKELNDILSVFEGDLSEDRKTAESLGDTRLKSALTDADKTIASAGEKKAVEAPTAPKVQEAKTINVMAERKPDVAEPQLTVRDRRAIAQAQAEARASARAVFDEANHEHYANYKKELREACSKYFLNVPDMEIYLIRDVDGNVKEWTQDGQRILDTVVREQFEIRQNDAFNVYYDKGEGLQNKNKDFFRYVKEISSTQLTAAIGKACRAFEAQYIVSENLRPKNAAPDVPKGGGVFGLDADRLSKEQRLGLLSLLRCFPGLAKTAVDDKVLRLRHLPYRHSYEMNMATALEKAIHTGALRLETLTDGLANLLMGALQDYELHASISNDRSGAGMGFGTNDVGTILKIVGDGGLSPDRFVGMSPEKAKDYRKFFNTLLVLNGNDSTGLDDLCRRVYGGSLADVSEKIVSSDGKSRELELMNKIYGDSVSSKSNDTSWRAKYDPYARAKRTEQRVVAMLRMEYAYATAKRGQDKPSAMPKEVNVSLEEDRKALLDFRQMLADVSSGPAPKTVSGKIGGVAVTLALDASGALKATVQLAKSQLTFDEDGLVKGVKHENGTVGIPVTVPLKPDAMLEMLDETILANVPLFNRETVAQIFTAAKNKPGFATSSQMRQTCVTVFKSFANVDAAKLCFLPTEELVGLVDRLLGQEGDRYEAIVSLKERQLRVEHDMLSSAVLDETLNSRATLEVYQKYADACKANPEDVNAKVSVPEPDRLRKNETLTASRIRRLHEFVADLIQPNDTTKFDMDRAKLTPDAIMRQTLLAHPDELQELLAMTDGDIREFFTLQGAGGRLDAFAVEVMKLATGLRAIRDAEGEATLFSKLRYDFDPATEKLLKAASEGLSKSSGSVLVNLQGAFQDLFVTAFGKNAEIRKTEIWKSTLDELANTMDIDPNKGYGGFLKEVLGSYFGQMTPTDCQRMAALTMRYAHADASLGQVLGGLLKGAGPILQKLMQGLPQSALPPELQLAVEDLKSNLAPIAAEAVRAHLYDVVQESNGRITNITVLKSLGAASVGEAFLCMVKTPEHPEGEECVIKILRPEVQNRARRENQFFQRILNTDPRYKIMLNERFARIFDELDLTIEGANVAQGMRYNPNGDWYAPLRVRSMKMHPAARSTANVLFLRCAPGTTYDRYVAHLRAERMRLQASVETVVENGYVCYVASDPYAQNNASATAYRLYVEAIQRQKDLADFVTRWMEEVAFGSGFFHGDVHAGNIMTDGRGLTVIDYGNASQFTHAQQMKVANLLVAAVRNKPDEFFSTYVSFLSVAGQKDAAEKSARIKKDLSEIFAKGGIADVGKRFVAALQYMQNADVELPGELFNLIECMRRLDESLVSMQKELDGLRRLTSRMAAEVGREIKGKYWFDEELVTELNRLRMSGNQFYDEGKVKKKVSNVIFEACQVDRRKFEETMADVRKLVRNADVDRNLDCRSKLESLLNAMEDPSSFLDKNRQDGEKVWRDFADAVADCIVQIQKTVIDGFDSGLGISANSIRVMSTGVSFTDAIETACMRHYDEIVSAMGVGTKVKVGFGVIRKALGVDTKTEEEKYAERLDDLEKKLKHTKQGLLRGFTTEEWELTASFGRYFALPSDFKDIVKKPGWVSNAEKCDKVLKSLHVTYKKLGDAFEARRVAGDPVPSRDSDKKGGSLKNCLPLLAAYFGVRLENSGFHRLSDVEKQSLYSAAYAFKPPSFVDFIKYVVQFADEKLNP